MAFVFEIICFRASSAVLLNVFFVMGQFFNSSCRVCAIEKVTEIIS